MDSPQLEWKEDLHIPNHLKLYMQNERIVSFSLWWWYWKSITYTQGHNLQNIHIIQANIKNHIQKAMRCNVENDEDAMNLESST